MMSFVPLCEDALPQVLAWRSDPETSRYLYTDITPDLDLQREWFHKVSADHMWRHWLIRCGHRNVGLAYLSDIDWTNLRCSCGFYIGEKSFRRFGGLVLPGIVNYVFERLNFHKIYGEVMEGNDNVLKLHDFHGYRKVGVYQGHVLKYGRFHNIHVFELLRSRWEELQGHYSQFRIPVLGHEGEETCE